MNAKQLQIGSIVEVPGPIFDQRPGRKPRRLTFHGKVLSFYQAKGGPAATVKFVGLGDKVAEGNYLLKNIKLAQSLPQPGSTYREVLDSKLFNQ